MQRPSSGCGNNHLVTQKMNLPPPTCCVINMFFGLLHPTMMHLNSVASKDLIHTPKLSTVANHSHDQRRLPDSDDVQGMPPRVLVCIAPLTSMHSPTVHW